MAGLGAPGHRALPALALAVAGIALVAISSAVYGYALLAGVLAVALAAGGGSLDRARAAAAAAGAVTVVVAVAASFDVREEGSAGWGDGDRARSTAGDRERFCTSERADAMDRVAVGRLDSEARLRRATDQVLELADGAPAGAPCAVIALDAIADTWNLRLGERGYDDAGRQLERIRSFQRDNGLLTAEF